MNNLSDVSHIHFYRALVPLSGFERNIHNTIAINRTSKIERKSVYQAKSALSTLLSPSSISSTSQVAKLTNLLLQKRRRLTARDL